MAEVSDLSVIYITANVIPEKFAVVARDILFYARGDAHLISVSKKSLPYGDNIYVGDTPRNQANIYRQALVGAKESRTKYIAIAEDDVLYSAEHFKFRPKQGHWGYNMNSWNLFTWEPNFFSQKPGGRRNLNGLICERDMFIEHLEERFRLWPDDSKINISIFGEPGKYDNQLGTTPYPSQYFYPNPPNIVFSHENNLQFSGLGKRKKVGEIRATEIPGWGTAEEVSKIYG
jgi:hypothetical protein